MIRQLMRWLVVLVSVIALVATSAGNWAYAGLAMLLATSLELVAAAFLGEGKSKS